MKTFVILTCLALASAMPYRRDEGGDGGEPPFPERPEGEVKPLTLDHVMGLMSDVKAFAAEARGHFENLERDADAIDGSEASLDELGGKTQKMMEDLGKLAEEKEGNLGRKWMEGMARLVYAGVEDEGQCHKVLEFLFAAMEKVKERQMSAEELEFWQKLVGAAKKEVKCIINRFHEFEGLITHVEETIKNPPAGYNEEGHAFEAEVTFGAIYFGYQSVRRQVVVFVAVMHGLMEEAEPEEPRSLQQLRALLKQAESLESRMKTLDSRFKSLPAARHEKQGFRLF